MSMSDDDATSEAQEEIGLGCNIGRGGVVGESGGDTKATDGGFGTGVRSVVGEDSPVSF